MAAIHEYFFAPPRSALAQNPWWKYGFLAFVGCLLIVQTYCFLTLAPGHPSTRYAGFVVPVMLILNHLSAYFYFGPRFTFPLRLFSTVFLLAALVFLFWQLSRY
ncbi:hypothetical protein BH09VER1_BH09VER1_49340 [soil metagenome]